MTSDDIAAAIVMLAKLTKNEPIDLRYSRGMWSVMQPRENVMTTIKGSVSASPLTSLEYCIKKWMDRSPHQAYD